MMAYGCLASLGLYCAIALALVQPAILPFVVILGLVAIGRKRDWPLY